MMDPDIKGKSPSRLLWIIILILLFVLVVGWFVSPMGKVEQAPPPAPATQPTDWAEEPESPGVDVTLPQTPLTNAPAEPASEAAPAESPTG